MRESDPYKILRRTAKLRAMTIDEIEMSIKVARNILEYPESKFSNTEEIEEIKAALTSITTFKSRLIDLIDQCEAQIFREYRRDGKNHEKEFLGLWDLVFSVFTSVSLINAIGHVSAFAERSAEMSRAFDMQRKKRSAQAPSEAALIDAIKAEQGAEVPPQPHKVAGAILGDVNRRLESAGFEPVKIDKIARRLAKWHALLKSAEEQGE